MYGGGFCRGFVHVCIKGAVTVRSYFIVFLQSHNAKDRGVRFRCCQLINKLLTNLGEDAQIDDELYDRLYECMLERLKDKWPVVRYHAVMAMSRLQDPSDENCPVIKGEYHIHPKYLNTLTPYYTTVNVLKFRTPKCLTKWHMQTVKTQIRLLLREQSNHGLHCLHFHLVFYETTD